MVKRTSQQRYIDLIKQTFYFDTPDFTVTNDELNFYGVELMPIIEKYGTPLRLTYLPKISENIRRARSHFGEAMKKLNYDAEYVYCYCTKSSHFNFIMEEVLKTGAHLETSSTFDIAIIKKLHQKGLFTKDKYVVCNGFKRETYTNEIKSLWEDGFENCIAVLDNRREITAYEDLEVEQMQIGLRIATEEEPNFSFYTSRLGIRYKDVVEFYKKHVATNPKFKLSLLHFFVNTGIRDTVYFWSEFNKFVRAYCDLKKICPELHILDIGGGLPIKNTLGFDYDYEYMTEAIVSNIQEVCEQEGVPVPTIFSEFGSFTVGESGAMIFSVKAQKQQNDRELWYMIDGSFITHLPDTWGMGYRFITMAINNWDKEYQQVHVGGITCDSMDYYDSESHVSKLMLPKFTRGTEQYVGFFHTGAYQESLGGYGGIQHCLIPNAQHVIIDRDEQGNVTTKLFNKEQTAEQVLDILGY